MWRATAKSDRRCKVGRTNQVRAVEEWPPTAGAGGGEAELKDPKECHIFGLEMMQATFKKPGKQQIECRLSTEWRGNQEKEKMQLECAGERRKREKSVMHSENKGNRHA